MEKLSIYSDYITINISSPNTEGLRDFHNKKEMEKLLTGTWKEEFLVGLLIFYVELLSAGSSMIIQMDIEYIHLKQQILLQIIVVK